MLSIPVVHDLTGAATLLLFRHAGAALTSYRRMGWSPDVSELTPIITEFTSLHGHQPGVEPPPVGVDEVARMAWFWNALYGMALFDADRLGEKVTVLAHEDIAGGGGAFAQELFQHLDLSWQTEITAQLNRGGMQAPTKANALHNFDRNPAQVAREWESKLSEKERSDLEIRTRVVMSMLRERAFCPTGDIAPGTGARAPDPKRRRK